MSSTLLANVTDQIQKFWSPIFTPELREKLLLGSLVDRTYEGEIKNQGDTVRISQIKKLDGQLLTAGVNSESFQSETIQTTKVDIQASKVAIAAVEVESLVEIQSQIQSDSSELRTAMQFAVEKQINDYLYSLVAPSASAPDHVINSVTDFNASQLLAARLLAAQAKWPKDQKWYVLADPSYYNDVLNATTLTSGDYVDDKPVVGGIVGTRRFGFNIIEDDSRSVDQALIFHPSFLNLVMQTQATFKLSDLHSQKKRGYLLSVELLFGAGLGIEGAVKHITVKAAASG